MILKCIYKLLAESTSTASPLDVLCLLYSIVHDIPTGDQESDKRIKIIKHPLYCKIDQSDCYVCYNYNQTPTISMQNIPVSVNREKPREIPT